MGGLLEFTNKTILITGGTGSFGRAVLQCFLASGCREVRIFSRDEKKQEDLRRHYQDERLKLYLGDVRSPESLREPCEGADCVFHAAALKQVPSCEFFPLEAMMTNALGTENVLAAAVAAKAARVVCLSTDKAAYPINVMGLTKALMEKIMAAKARRSAGHTVICGTRYGNVMCSRGSVIPLFIEQIRRGGPLTVTNPAMTRFLMSLEEAVALVLFAFQEGRPGDLFIHKAPAASIGDLAQAVRELFGPETPLRFIGPRHGEKLFETLATAEEKARAEDLGGFIRVPVDQRDLNYDCYFDTGAPEMVFPEPYTSHNTERLSVPQIKEKLLGLDYVRRELEASGGRT